MPPELLGAALEQAREGIDRGIWSAGRKRGEIYAGLLPPGERVTLHASQARAAARQMAALRLLRTVSVAGGMRRGCRFQAAQVLPHGRWPAQVHAATGHVPVVERDHGVLPVAAHTKGRLRVDPKVLLLDCERVSNAKCQ